MGTASGVGPARVDRARVADRPGCKFISWASEGGITAPSAGSCPPPSPDQARPARQRSICAPSEAQAWVPNKRLHRSRNVRQIPRRGIDRWVAARRHGTNDAYSLAMNPSGQFTLCVFAAAVLLGPGCAHAPTPPDHAAPAEAPPVPLTSAVVEAAQPNLTVSISSELMAACGVEFSNIDSAPRFDFDESTLTSDDEAALRKVAECVTTGALAGRSVELVGRADPRGEEEYNMVLGAHRAASASTFLVAAGVNPGQLTQSSRGKLDATGSSESGWRRDRRVDVLLR